MNKSNIVVSFLPEEVYALICETLRLDCTSKAFDPELRENIREAADILSDSRHLFSVNQPLQEMLTLNNTLTFYYLKSLTDAHESQIHEWHVQALTDVKDAAFQALKNHYFIELPSDDPKKVLLREVAKAKSVEELVELGFTCKGKCRDNSSWDVADSIWLWENPDNVSVLTEELGGRFFSVLGEKDMPLIKRLVNSNRLSIFMNTGVFVYPPKKNSSPYDVMSVVWKDLDQESLHSILHEYPHYHVFSLISLDDGQRIVAGERTNCVGYILTRYHLFIDEGIDVPMKKDSLFWRTPALQHRFFRSLINLKHICHRLSPHRK